LKHHCSPHRFLRLSAFETAGGRIVSLLGLSFFAFALYCFAIAQQHLTAKAGWPND